LGGIVEIVMLEKLDCILSKRATKANIYESASTAECHQPVSESTVVSGHTRHLRLRPYDTSPSPAIRDSSPAETCICNRHIDYHHSVTTAFLASGIYHSEDHGHPQSLSLKTPRTEVIVHGKAGKVITKQDLC
jgi:hypothetical protein